MDKEKYIDITLDRVGRIELFYLIISSLSKLNFTKSTIRKRFTSSIDDKTIGLTFELYDDCVFGIVCRDTNYAFELDELSYILNKVNFSKVYDEDAIVNDDLIDSVVDLICYNLHINIKFFD